MCSYHILKQHVNYMQYQGFVGTPLVALGGQNIAIHNNRIIQCTLVSEIETRKYNNRAGV